MIDELRNEKGSLMVESAVLLPVFLVGVLILAYLIKGLYIQEQVHAICADQAVKLSVETAAAPSLGTQLTYGLRVKQRIREKDPAVDFDLEAWAAKQDEDWSLKIFYQVPMDFPVSLGGGLSVGERLLVRSWTGKEEAGSPMAFSDMEQQGSGEMVWVFPQAGEKYHKEDCRYVSVYPVEKLLNSQVRSKYEPCQLCSAAELENGAVVYCFEKYGNVYHSYSCSTVDRYVIQISGQDAEAGGYGHCSLCGG